MQQMAIRAAASLLGVTGGVLRPYICLHSQRFRRRLARLRLLKVLRRELQDRKQAGNVETPSRAMRQAWDAGLFPSPGEFRSLTTLWSSETTFVWAEAAVDHLRSLEKHRFVWRRHSGCIARRSTWSRSAVAKWLSTTFGSAEVLGACCDLRTRGSIPMRCAHVHRIA
jgi:hypothetical protein